MFDLFYYGPKPNLFAFEKPAVDLHDAAKQAKTRFFWFIYGGNDYTGFNFDYTPLPWQEHFTHVWADQHNNDGNVYLTQNPDADKHYLTEQRVHRLPVLECFYIPGNIDPHSIDYRWSPNPNDPPYIYHFPSQHQSASGVTYTVPGATDIKLVDDFVVNALPVVLDNNFWVQNYTVEDFDYTWHPNPLDPPYIYIWGNQWYAPEYDPTVEFHVEGAVETKYMERRAKCSPVFENWEVKDDVADFDYSWHPNPKDPAYIYAFGNQWMPPEVRTSVVFAVDGATEVKYMHEPKAYRKGSPEKFITHYDCQFDYSWEPDPGSPPYNYVWGNQWWPAEKMATVEYRMPGATETKYMDQPGAKLSPTWTNWVNHYDAPYDFDFSWCPDPGDPPYIYVFGNQHWSGERSATVEYHVPGATEKKFIHNVTAKLEALDIFFVDRSNPTAQSRYDLLLERFPNAQKIRYANSIMDTIKRCINRAKTPRFWIISSEYNYDSFNFDWQPEPWQSYMTHVFPSQHNKWSDTFLINKWEFERHATWAESLEQFPNLNFVTNQQVTKTENLCDIYYVDHGNEESDTQFKQLREAHPDIIKTRFANDYLSVLKRIITNANTEYVWVLNSICDYSKFDFTWQPGAWEREQIHCFSNSAGNWMEKRGDTFYLPVEVFKSQMYELELLDWFNVISYNDTLEVNRWPIPIVTYEGDDLISVIKQHDFKTVFTIFTKDERVQSSYIDDCVWTEKDRTVRPFNLSGSTSLVPRDIKKYLKTQVYDYPHLFKYETGLPYNYYSERPQDVIFISYDETNADENYEKLKAQLESNPYNNVSIKRLHGVEGMDNALKRAAEMSETPWYFAVFAKTKVAPEFKFNFNPDYWQQPKHYIFYSHNPMNGLEYGHMGVVLYNCNIVKNMTEFGIDYTMSAAHEVVPQISSIAEFNTTPYQTWRTAFRECAKLSQFVDEQPTLETEHRLKVWTTRAEGNHAEWCLRGANDGVKFYQAHKNNKAQLKNAFNWAWLQQYFDSLYS